MDEERERTRVGLCFDCRHSRRVPSDHGSLFYLCERALSDPEFDQYPMLPVIRCPGFEPDARSRNPSQGAS